MIHKKKTLFFSSRFKPIHKINLRPICEVLNSLSRSIRRFSRCSSSTRCRSKWLRSTRVASGTIFSVVCWDVGNDVYDNGGWVGGKIGATFACAVGTG
jgi:hypothetical protein